MAYEGYRNKVARKEYKKNYMREYRVRLNQKAKEDQETINLALGLALRRANMNATN